MLLLTLIFYFPLCDANQLLGGQRVTAGQKLILIAIFAGFFLGFYLIRKCIYRLWKRYRKNHATSNVTLEYGPISREPNIVCDAGLQNHDLARYTKEDEKHGV
uniref:Uncharacterized protein n=1 Tax=Acrobeloides nanus TaxID=290746 RepID=A0A914DH51_9BILA